MDDEEFATKLSGLELRGEAGKADLWQHIKSNGGMRRVAALALKGARVKGKKKPHALTLVDPLPELSGPVLFNIPLIDKTEFSLREAIVRDFATAYPGVDIEQEFRAMRAWCISNPQLCKTRGGIMRFVNSWLARAQNNCGARPNSAPPQHRNGVAASTIKLAENDLVP